MNCMTECYLASAFMGGSIFLMFNHNKKSYKKLSKEKKVKFDNIRKDRTLIWVKASIVAIFVSITISKFGKYLFGMENPFNRSCINTFVFYAVQHLVYVLHPKKDWMLNHLDSKEEVKWWLSTYRSMQYNWHIGLVLGLIGYYFINMFIFNLSTNVIKK